ncbi:LOW QUALITY PROTEIN: regulator of G-protein signaling 22-like [Haliotis rubra]|uniref:LOW QUALITY PROTEIN: regulator of G-protein signaling 22-like n=1 Tax=Haliotis rubra TaxID=36100 RepID=UPI001EE5C744|nr:LOW QUALITY PROTEIN: regulator of G-protein signaling 22-like [Haliotis rubra]
MDNMMSNVCVVKIEPAEVDVDDVEDFLATDDLFVEYFNAYLSLPSFPEPLCFNKDTGGFEVVNNAKKELAQQIKAAIRSQRRTPRMYHVAKLHSFIDIPLIPIEEPMGPEKVEIDTSFTVTTLNKEQGIHWVKAERLPSFLESDCYLEYRLASIISQARLSQDGKAFAIMKIDYKPRIKRSKKKDDDEPKVDPKEELIKNMYVCMGNASTTDTDAWFSEAQMVQNTETTFSTMSRPQSAVRPSSARPVSVMGLTDLSRRCDSGFGSPSKSSVFGSGYFGSRHGIYPEESAEDDLPSNRLFSSSSLKPNTPRPSEPVCVMANMDDQRGSRHGAMVYAYPRSETTDTESGMGDTEEDRDEELSTDQEAQQTLDTENQSDQDLQKKFESVIVESIDDLGAVIVGAVLKRCIATIIDEDERSIESDPQIQGMFPRKKYSHITMDMLDHLSIGPNPKEPTQLQEVELEEPEKELDQLQEKKEESDVDSLLDSEEDYEEQDTFFRKHKHRTYDLTKLKGVQQFKAFLEGTLGEKHWNFWVDIDRSRMIKSEEHTLIYLANMREKYQHPGSPYELSMEWKILLGLVEPSSWSVERLLSIQNKVAEPLVLYWAPRYLLKQMAPSNPDRYYLYHHQQLLKRKKEVYPNPPTAVILPLRPRSCMPRTQHTAVITEALAPVLPEVLSAPTSPPVGLKRVYARPSTVSSHRESVKTHNKKPKELLSPRMKVDRVTSARVRTATTARAQSAVPRQKSAKATASRPVSALSDSSDSWESASVMSDRLSPRHTSRPVSGRPSSSLLSPRRTSRPVSPSNMLSPTTPARPSSAASVKSMSTVSEFTGGRRMEALLQALHHERSSGGFFRKFIERGKNKLWLSALNFWREVQEYHLLFYTDVIDHYMLEKKAHAVYSQYIVRGAMYDIGCSGPIRDEIYRCLDPPYEELFDAAEEHSLAILYDAWLFNLDDDVKTYSKVELIDVKRHLETRSKYVLHLQKRGLIKERVLTPDDPMEGFEDPVYDESLLENIPPDFRDYTLEKLIHNRIELEHFRQFLADNYASMDLMCWMDIEAWRRITHSDEKKRDQKAKEIKTKYLNKKYFFGPNSPAGKEGQDKVMAAGGGWGKLLDDRPPNSVLLEAQKYVRERLERKWLPLFLVTPEFEDRQRPRTGMDDVVDDVLVQKRRRSQALSKLLESRWISSSNEILTFRKALMNPVTSLQFRRYVSIKGDNLENDVLFWLEVQKYKELHHANTDDSLILQKINAIINCFIDSQIPPSLQVDIPTELADKILDRKYEKGPYLFREAQLTVFRILFSQWNDFCEFRANLTEEKILPTIERRRRHAKSRQKRNHREIEEKASKERERRIALGLPVDGEEDDDLFIDPFKAMDESEAELEDREGDKVSWTYSNYMRALEKEDLLNNTDESMFSSLTDGNSFKELNLEMIAENLGREDSPPPSNKKSVRSEETQTTPYKKASRAETSLKLVEDKSPRRSPEPASGKPKGTEEAKLSPRLLSPRLQEACPAKTHQEKITPTKTIQGKTTPTSHSHPGAAMKLMDLDKGKVKLSRQIPPLVQKK